MTYNSSKTLCQQCPADSFSNDQRTNCSCGIGFYAVFDLDDLEVIDREAYNDYMNAGDDGFNPHDELGWRCAGCPDGADCDSPGTTIDNVEPLPGYFLGTYCFSFYVSLFGCSVLGSVVATLTSCC